MALHAQRLHIVPIESQRIVAAVERYHVVYLLRQSPLAVTLTLFAERIVLELLVAEPEPIVAIASFRSGATLTVGFPIWLGLRTCSALVAAFGLRVDDSCSA